MDHALIRRWLKLPAGNWPPDHYTLLGLAPGESDPRRIEQHVQVRIECVRKHQLTCPDEVTEAMSRLAQALVCLTDAGAKKAYDGALLPLADGRRGRAAERQRRGFSWTSLDGSGEGLSAPDAGRPRSPFPHRWLAAALAVAGVVAAVLAWCLAKPDDLAGTPPAVADNPDHRCPELRRWRRFSAQVTSVAFSCDGSWLFAGTDRVYLWKRTSDQPRGQHAEDLGPVRSVAFSPDGQHFATGGEDKVLLWEMAKRQVVRPFADHAGAVTSLAFSADGRQLVSGGADKTVRLWDVAGGESVRFAGSEAPVTAVALSSDGLRVLSAARDDTLRIWDIGKRRERRRLSGAPGEFLVAAFSPGGRYALSSDGKAVRLLDVEQTREPRPLPAPGGRVTCLAISRDGGLALAGKEDGTIQVWDAATGQESGRCVGHRGPVVSIALSPDGRLALSGGADKTVRLWQLAE
ncbi:MAG TPA: WD40 repeat domain-containing protein [Gemmataceae bacterium]|jgi:hypothetical protein|nr:WD40 repeat domain-containing protein [Gemmataceae bacterium]